MVIVPGGTDRLSLALSQAIWVSSQSGRLPEALALWVVRELAAADAVVAAAFTPEGRARLPQEEPAISRELHQEPGAAVAPALAQALTDVLYALDRAGREPEGMVVVEVVSARRALLDVLAWTYPTIRELLTLAAQPQRAVGITPGMGTGRGVCVREAR